MSEESKKVQKGSSVQEPKTIRRGGRQALNPDSILDDLAQTILQVEIANPGITTSEICILLGHRFERRTVIRRRSSPLYQRLLQDSRKTALEILIDSQAEALRKLRALVQNSDPKVALGAAKTLAQITIDQASIHTHKEIARLRRENPETHIVKVVFGGKRNWVIGDAPKQVKDVEAAVAGSESRSPEFVQPLVGPANSGDSLPSSSQNPPGAKGSSDPAANDMPEQPAEQKRETWADVVGGGSTGEPGSVPVKKRRSTKKPEPDDDPDKPIGMA